MGDRAMAEIKVREGSIYFYTHWYGRSLPQLAERALEKAQPRIGDDSYATKIVLGSLMSDTDTVNTETGAGVMLSPSAEDYYSTVSGDASVLIDLVENKLVIRRKGNEKYPD